ncbi:hypothetical protein M2451_001693 [Dysgonomonas sp. PFB1-18]|uniref:hypothetical protein n=1 Tax=unclassified Dysgonomonas TaxID=2630389 RepID=UPI002475B0AC|nr:MULTISPECIES: hypothetical protein [unclassified Dysgonomonas]MDL2303483.1 hypothetical protein [Dysgonomonas sp. OttesenSCG-928-D17]MDH6309122.1 hypothetical protein [Dysgonomonas sp. PF1-14]MDH6338998.1 hypothetical protein [Dysgonomonas sp. PF1-16]MDH6380371.1 hypothetical protein [Dysgonomonas sp. PFB1-18]MDH6397826.1 hypothetical protein [Dysgonomonas sp. PF1-23]
MLKRLSKILPYMVLAPLFSIAAFLLSILVFGVIYSATNADYVNYYYIIRILFGVSFFCMPAFIVLAVICMRRATVNNEKYAVWGIVIAIFPALYAGFVYVLFVPHLINVLFYWS